MKKNCLLVLVCGWLLGACSAIEMGTLEFRTLDAFRLTEKRTEHGLSLSIEGSSAASAVGIRRIIVVTRGDQLTVLPKLVLAHEGVTGNFYYTLNVPPNIRRVNFGEEGVEIWPKVPKVQTLPFPGAAPDGRAPAR